MTAAAQPKSSIRFTRTGSRSWSKTVTLFHGSRTPAPALLQFGAPLSKVDGKTRSPAEPVYAGQRAICMPFIQVDLLMTYSKRSDLLFDLATAVERVRNAEAHLVAEPDSVRSDQAPRVWRLADRLSEEDEQRLVSLFLEGATVMQLVEKFSLGRSSVKKVLRTHGARRQLKVAE